MTTTVPSLPNLQQAILLAIAIVLPTFVAYLTVVPQMSYVVLVGSVLGAIVVFVKEIQGDGFTPNEQAVLMLAAFVISPISTLLLAGTVSSLALVAGALGGLVVFAKEGAPNLSNRVQAILMAIAFVIPPIIPALTSTPLSWAIIVAAILAGLIAYAKEVDQTTVTVPTPVTTTPATTPTSTTTSAPTA